MLFHVVTSANSLLVVSDQAPHRGKRGKRSAWAKKKIGSEANREVFWGEERVAPPRQLLADIFPI